MNPLYSLRAISLGILTALTIFCNASLSIGGQVTLAWDPNTEYDLAGYNLYIKEGSSIKPNDSDALIIAIPLSSDGFNPDTPRYTVTELVDDIVYYFVVSAFNDYGVESGYSNEVSIKNEKPYVVPQSSSSGSNGGCMIDAVTSKMPNE
jgi:hypothetical protein